jgi:hypothetical protein
MHLCFWDRGYCVQYLGDYARVVILETATP